MSEAYDDRQIEALLAEFPAWERTSRGELCRRVQCRDFAHAMLYVAAVGHLAEVADHHPDIRVHGYRNVELTLISHDVGAITDRDRGLVAAVERLSVPG